jgi:hypothetical protein
LYDQSELHRDRGNTIRFPVLSSKDSSLYYSNQWAQ